MSRWQTVEEADAVEEQIRSALPEADVIRYEETEYWFIVRIPGVESAYLTGESGDLAGDIEDLKALAEGREP